MNAYTISNLAEDAGVTVHVIRDYESRGLLHPSERTEYGYRLYDQRALERLRFVLIGKTAGLSLSELARLCEALDECDHDKLSHCIDRIEQQIKDRHELLSTFAQKLAHLRDTMYAGITKGQIR